MKFLLLIVIVLAAIVVAAWLLPWWLTLTLAVVIIAPIVWIVWKIVSTVKKQVIPALKDVAKGMPRAQERLCTLPRGESFRGNGFTFAFPVACEVSQTVIDDLEALVLKPALDDCASGTNGILIVSTIAREELKTQINDELESVFAKVKAYLAQQPAPGQDIQTEDFRPMEVGALKGESRIMEFSNAEKKLRGETVYLGDPTHSVGWALIGPAETFEAAATRFRELAGLIQRVDEPVPAVKILNQ